MVERWGIYEITLNGPDTGNPFTEVELTAEFKQDDRTFEPHGFYDGNGIYKNWEGKLSNIAIYSRFVGVEEAAHKFKLIQVE